MSAFLLYAVLFQAVNANANITGQLRSTNGQSVAGVRVSAMAVPDQGVPLSGASTLVSVVQTDAEGRYRLENVPAGRYYVIAGLLDSPTYYPGTASATEAKVVEVTAEQTVPDINFPIVVAIGLSVSGRVSFPQGQPINGTVRATLSGGAGPPFPQTTVQADGTFSFQKVRPGTYSLNIAAPVGAMLMQPTTVVVGDTDITDLNAVFARAVRVSNTLVIEGDGPQPRLSILFAPFRGGFNVPAGVFTRGASTMLPEGDYRVGWSALPAGFYVKSLTAGEIDLLANHLVLSGSDPVSIVMTLGVSEPPPWVQVSGKISGNPTALSGTYRLQLAGGAMDTLDVPINPDGSFTIARILPGMYTARVSPPLPIPPVQVAVPNRNVTDLILTFPALKEVNGRIVEGSTLTTPRLSLITTDANGGSTAVTSIVNNDGSFRITLPEGERRVTLNVLGYTVRSFKYGVKDLLQDPMLRITSADTAEFEISLGPSSAPLSGVTTPGVVFAGGVPGGVLGGITVVPGGGVGATVAPPPPPASLPLPSASVRISSDVAQTYLISAPVAVMPALARAAQVSGSVTVQVVISREGRVLNTAVLSGHPLLNDAAMEAVRNYRFRPYLINGAPVEVTTTITVNFAP